MLRRYKEKFKKNLYTILDICSPLLAFAVTSNQVRQPWGEPKETGKRGSDDL